MNLTACEERGADLFPVARGAAPSAELAAHLASCGGCRADLERLRALARDLPAASAGLAPRPATRAALLRDAGAPALPASPARSAPPPPPAGLPRRGRLLRVLLPLAAAAAILVAALYALEGGLPGTRVETPAGSVEVRATWNGAALDGLLPGPLPAGAEIAARRIASLRLGPPLEAEVVLGEGSRLRLPGRGRAREVEIVEGVGFFEPAPAGGPGAPVPEGLLRVRAGGVVVEDHGSRFTLERRASGAAEVFVETGVVAVESGGAVVTASGPCRVDVEPGAKPSSPVPAEPGDATGWFAYPDLLLEERAGAAPGDRDLVLTLRPAVPRPIRIAPWDRFSPLFSLQAEAPGKSPVTIPVKAAMLRLPPHPGDADGAFLLSAERPYRIVLDPASLKLAPGPWRLTAVYAAGRPGRLWRGTRASNPMDFEVKAAGGR